MHPEQREAYVQLVQAFRRYGTLWNCKDGTAYWLSNANEVAELLTEEEYFDRFTFNEIRAGATAIARAATAASNPSRIFPDWAGTDIVKFDFDDLCFGLCLPLEAMVLASAPEQRHCPKQEGRRFRSSL